MSATKTKPWTSGFCGPSNDKASHGRCHGHNGQGKACSCTKAFDDGTTCHTISEAAVSEPPAVVSDQDPAGGIGEALSPAGPDASGACATAAPLVITEPCVLPDLDELVYHRDPVPESLGRSLSHSGAKKLLGTTPAHFHYERENGRPAKKAFDYGHAAHLKVLGTGMEIVEVEFDSWRTKASQEQQEQAYAEGKTPLLSKDVRKVEAMAKVLHEHPLAGPLLKGEGVQVELSMFWQDPATGVFRRARTDIARLSGRGRPMLVDYKSTVCADPAAFIKSVIDYGYFTQDPWYCDGVAALDLADPKDLAFAFIAQEKEPPFAVSVNYLDATFVRIGRQTNRRALDLYAECLESGIWPGYPQEPVLLTPPDWFVRKHDERYIA